MRNNIKTKKLKNPNKTVKKLIYKEEELKRQLGGKKIGRGAYSCVIKPALSCPTSTKKSLTGKISKILRKDAFKKTNKKLNTLLSKIDKNKDYLIYYDKYCKADISKLKTRKYRDIKVIKDYNDNENELISELITFEDTNCIIKPDHKYINIIESYGGSTIHDIYIHDKKIKKPYEVVLQLLQGLKLMHDNNIVHRDIKIDNIVIDDKNIARYIDFNVSKITKDIPDKYISLVGNFKYNISLDYIILYYLHLLITYKGYKFNNKLVKTINNICYKKYKSYVQTLSGLKISFTDLLTNTTMVSDDMSDIFINGYNENKFVALIRFMYKIYKNSSFSKYYKEEYLYKNDIYGLGILFKIIIFKNGLDIKANEQARKLNILANNMIVINPKKRFNINNCLDFWLNQY